jgi:ABC-type transport system involved in cytochrome bd biosynthesis fused ATPase/permease subunit
MRATRAALESAFDWEIALLLSDSPFPRPQGERLRAIVAGRAARPHLRLAAMPLITVRDLSVGFRGPLLLDGVTCQIDAGQRIGLLGRNGAGKTTFMRVLCGDLAPEAGEVSFAPGVRLSLLPQDVRGILSAG